MLVSWRLFRGCACCVSAYPAGSTNGKPPPRPTWCCQPDGPPKWTTRLKLTLTRRQTAFLKRWRVLAAPDKLSDPFVSGKNWGRLPYGSGAAPGGEKLKPLYSSTCLTGLRCTGCSDGYCAFADFVTICSRVLMRPCLLAVFSTPPAARKGTGQAPIPAPVLPP